MFFQIRLPNGQQLRKKLDRNTTLGQLWKDILGEAEDQTNGYSGFMQVWVYLCTQWCTANADVCSEPRASNFLSSYFNPEVCQNIALFAFTAARNFAFQVPTFWVHSAAFFLALFFSSPVFFRC